MCISKGKSYYKCFDRITKVLDKNPEALCPVVVLISNKDVKVGVRIILDGCG